MNRKMMHFFVVIFFGIGIIGSNIFGFTHPGGFNTKAELDFIKEKVNAGTNPWKEAFDKLTTNEWGRLTYTPKPYAKVECGSHNQPNIGCNEMVYDGMAAYNHALQWYITDNTAHAKKSIEILNAWSYKYQTNTDFNDKLVASWAAPWYVNAAEIIRYTSAGWAGKDITQFKSMLNTLYSFATTGAMFNNGFMTQIEAQMAISIFLDDEAKFDKAVAEWKKYTPPHIYMQADGAHPLDGRRSYTEFGSSGYIEGQCQETCRDYGHSELGVRSIIGSATMAYTQGVDLFTLEKNRIKAFIEQHGKWTTGKETVPENICGGKVLCTGSSTKTMPCGAYAWEVAYRHIHDRLGVAMPVTLEMIQGAAPSDMERWNQKPETLTAHGIPFGGTIVQETPLVAKSQQSVAAISASAGQVIVSPIQFPAHVRILDTQGRVVVSRQLPESAHLTARVTGGVYFVRLQTPDESSAKTILVVR